MKRALILFFLLAGCADMTLAEHAYKEGDYAAAIAHWEELAEFGHPEASQKLSRAYYKLAREHEDTGDYEGAYAYFERALQLGNARAAQKIGRLYRDGKGVSKDYAQARHYFHKAIELGLENGYKDLEKLDKKKK